VKTEESFGFTDRISRCRSESETSLTAGVSKTASRYPQVFQDFVSPTLISFSPDIQSTPIALARLRKILLDTRLDNARKTSLRHTSLIPAFHYTRSMCFGIPCSFLLDFRIRGRIPLYSLWVMECASIRVLDFCTPSRQFSTPTPVARNSMSHLGLFVPHACHGCVLMLT
jgi:hypothetical protein